MGTVEIIKYSTDEKHQKLLEVLRAWSKRKQERQEQVWKDYEAGKYDETIRELREMKNQ